MYIGRYGGYLDVQVLVVCLSLMTFLILKLFSEIYSFTTRLLSSSNKLICAIEQSWIMKSVIWKTCEENVHLSQL